MIPTQAELIETFNRVFLSTNTGITKISPNSVFASFSAGIAGLAQKMLKETALVETYIDPDQATGDRLDAIARQRGIPTRQTTRTKSTVWIRLHAEGGTAYTTEHVFTGSHGITFNLMQGFTFPTNGTRFVYRQLQSTGGGLLNNVSVFSIDRIDNPPTGHVLAINDAPSFGGRDAETDDQFRYRIKNFTNISAYDTLAKISILANQQVNSIFRVYNLGKAVNGDARLGVITHSGEALTPDELTTLNGLRVFAPLSNSNLQFESLPAERLDITAVLELRDTEQTRDIADRILVRINNFLREVVYNEESTFIDWVTIFNLINIDPGVISLSSDGFSPNSRIDISDRRPRQLGAIRFFNPNRQTLWSSIDPRFGNFYDLDSDFNITTNFVG